MAWTKTNRHQTVFGNQRVVVYEVTPDDAEDNITVAELSVIDSIALGISSMDSGPHSLRIAQDSSGVASGANVIGASGFANGDHFYLTVFGR